MQKPMNAPQEKGALVAQSTGSFSLVPQNLSQAMELAKIIADSDLAPKDYKGNPESVIIAIQASGSGEGRSPSRCAMITRSVEPPMP